MSIFHTIFHGVKIIIIESKDTATPNVPVVALCVQQPVIIQCVRVKYLLVAIKQNQKKILVVKGKDIKTEKPRIKIPGTHQRVVSIWVK